MSIRSQKIRFASIISIFCVFSCVIGYFISNVEWATSKSSDDPLLISIQLPKNAPTLQMQTIFEKKPQNISYSVPALWIFGPAKTSTTSIYTALGDSFPHWYHPEPNKPFREYEQIWTIFLKESYFGSLRKYYYFQTLVDYLDYIIQNKSIQTLDQYPFHDILLLLKSYIIKKQIQMQHTVFADIINASRSNHDMMVIVKTPAHYYSPFIPIIFAYHISPINYKHNQYGTKILIFLRNSVKRTISWYSLFYTKRFITGYNNNYDAVFDLIRYQFNISIKYKALTNLRNMIVHRNTEYDDIVILNEYFKFFYGFSRLFKKCNAVEFSIEMDKECQDIDIGLYDEKWNYENIKYRHIKHVRHPIHMIFAGISYPHLLLPLTVYKQRNMLGTKLRLMSFNYIIQNPKHALYLMTCWSQGRQCDVDKFRKKHPNIWKNIRLPHQKHETLPIPEDIKDLLTTYYEDIIYKINNMLHRFNMKDDIFLGDWNPDNW